MALGHMGKPGVSDVFSRMDTQAIGQTASACNALCAVSPPARSPDSLIAE